MLNAKYLVRVKKKKKKENQEKNREPLKQSAFLINFIVLFKISEFIWEVKSSASESKIFKSFSSDQFSKGPLKAQISLRNSSQ